MEKRVIFYLKPDNINNNYIDDMKIYNTFATHIHIDIDINNYYDNYYDNLWVDLGIATEKNMTCIICITLNENNLYDNLFYDKLCDLINNNPLIKGIDINVENNVSLENTKKFIINFKQDYPDLLLIMSTIGYSMCVNDIDTLYEDEKIWSYSLFNKSNEAKLIDYYCCNFNEANLTMDSFEDMINNGFSPEKIIMGCNSNNFEAYDNYFELNQIKKHYPNMGGTFIKYYNDSPYKWDLNAWLCLTSK